MSSLPPPTQGERKFLTKSLELGDYNVVDVDNIRLKRFNGDAGLNHKYQWKRIHGGDLTVKRFSKHKESDHSAWGKATTTIHASSKEVFLWL